MQSVENRKLSLQETNKDERPSGGTGVEIRLQVRMASDVGRSSTRSEVSKFDQITLLTRTFIYKHHTV
jgi:hypothetical protein